MTHALRHQHTLGSPTVIEGFGYWSGQDVRLEFCPADVDTGVVFVRSDFERPRQIVARVDNRVEVPRRTNLVGEETSVEMVEHVMAALSGLQIDNCRVRVNRPEMPGCDGSSQRFVEALTAAGRVSQSRLRPQLTVTRTVRAGDEVCWVEAQPTGHAGLWIQYSLDYGPGPIGRQSIELQVTPSLFAQKLAAARTFVLQEEAQWLRKQGLGLRVTSSDLLVFGPHGPLENQLRFSDECVRHKALDLIGDLALARCDIHGRIIAHRSGHRLNAQLVRTLLATERIREDARSAA